MQISAKNTLSRLLLLILTLSVILSSLCSCFLFKKQYFAGSEDEIRANIAASLDGGGESYKTVQEYLSSWGIPEFDRVKFRYFESTVSLYYNYAPAPQVMTHAAELANIFLDEYYGEIDRADKTEVTNALLSCYARTLGDPYAIYRAAEATSDYEVDMSGKFGGIGVMIEYDHVEETLMVSVVYPDSPAEKAGVEVGDFIVGVDGKRVSDIGYLNAVNHVRGKIGTTVNITLLRGDREIEVSAVRAEVEEINVSYDIIEEKNLGYVQIIAFKGNTLEQFKEAIDALEAAGVAGIIFDLRGNPGGFLDSVVDVISYMIPSGHTIVSYNYKNMPTTTRKSTDDGDGDHTVNLPMVVIADEYTASAGEIFTAAVRDYRNQNMLKATIVGTTTFKKGIMQSSFGYKPDDSTLTMTIAFYNPPSGENYHGIGVSPDREVLLPEPVFDEAAGKYLPVHDTQLDAAVEELEKLINAN